MQQKAVIYNNTVQAMVSLLRGMKTLNIPFENPERDVRSILLISSLNRVSDVKMLRLMQDHAYSLIQIPAQSTAVLFSSQFVTKSHFQTLKSFSKVAVKEIKRKFLS